MNTNWVIEKNSVKKVIQKPDDIVELIESRDIFDDVIKKVTKMNRKAWIDCVKKNTLRVDDAIKIIDYLGYNIHISSK